MMKQLYLLKFLKHRLCLFMLFCFLVIAMQSIAQNTAQKTIAGVVKDLEGATLPGVSVKVKDDAKAAAVTNVDGKYQIKTSVPNPILVFSYIGYLTKEVPVNKLIV